ncbi:MAG: hypothetical protein M1834_001575 [Cirrosporium novae-zelandiae]|nr:MAG: hypothetical protein M1834_004092 [Cirrosporium novae-zelandiae]KAI9735560.1 MAG: hypothetical protein M1834_001575 [Cirrosporium novae-zelandiae]
MGKTKRKDKSHQGPDPVAGRPVKLPTDPETLALRNQKILPIVEALKSLEPKKRSEAAIAITNLIDDEKCRKLLLREGLVQILIGQTLSDSDPNVQVAGWGVVRNLALEEGPDFSVHLYRQGILTPLESALQMVYTTILAPDASFQKLKVSEQQSVWSMTESLMNILSSLASSTDEVVVPLSNANLLLEIQTELLTSDLVLENIKASILSYLQAITEDNDFMTAKISAISRLWSTLCKYQSQKSLAAITACGVLLNAAELHIKNRSLPKQQKERLDMINFEDIVAAIDLTLEDIRKADPQQFMELAKPLHLTLEVVASFATFIGSLSTDPSSVDDIEFSGFDDDDPATEDNDGDIDLDEMEAISGAAGGDFEDLKENDAMEVVNKNAEQNSAGLVKDPHNATDVRMHLMGRTVQLILPFIKSNNSSVLSDSLSALNNICWSQPEYNVLFEYSKNIQPICQQIWQDCIRPVILSNTADITLASQITTLAWGLARCSNLYVSDEELTKFMALYQASRTLGSPPKVPNNGKANPNSSLSATKTVGTLGPACIGLLGTFARQPAIAIPRNQTIGTFLVKLVVDLPETPADDVVEALNQLFDIYADKDFPYDEPVFVQGQFLGHLEVSLQKVQKMAKKIDERKEPEARSRANEAVLNLRAFIKYKKQERRG